MKIETSLSESMRAFRDDRLSKLDSGEIPVSLAQGARTVVHLLPASAFEPGGSVDLSQVPRRQGLAGISGESWGMSYDFEGLLLWDSGGEEETSSYVQLFRSGSVEIADSWLLSSGEDGARPAIEEFQKSVAATIRAWIGLLRDLSVRPPLALGLSLAGVRGWDLNAGATGDARLAPRTVDRDELIVPEVFLEDLAADLSPALKAAFDPIWNAGGYPGSKGL